LHKLSCLRNNVNILLSELNGQKAKEIKKLSFNSMEENTSPKDKRLEGLILLSLQSASSEHNQFISHPSTRFL
jgi:hypothetical protein